MTESQEPLKDEQIRILIDHIVERYGFDFRDYAFASLRRRISSILRSERLDSIAALQERILADSVAFQRFVHGISVSVTSMFRDPSFYATFRTEIVPLLATYPFIRLWLAGCSTGEEVYSIAILLHEEGLYDRSRIYATDVDVLSVKRAQEGIFPLAGMKEYSANHLKSGGKESLSTYYTADQENALFRNHLKSNIVFAQHNLVCDSSFNEFHVILCRNVLIYFNSALRERVLLLLHDSLITFGILGLGSKESLRFSDVEPCYEQFNANEKLYRRVI
jgi:chemotaxis protein methyltransferase CheR